MSLEPCLPASAALACSATPPSNTLEALACPAYFGWLASGSICRDMAAAGAKCCYQTLSSANRAPASPAACQHAR